MNRALGLLLLVMAAVSFSVAFVTSRRDFRPNKPNNRPKAKSFRHTKYFAKETAVVLLDTLAGPEFELIDVDGDGVLDIVPNGQSANNYLVAQDATMVDLVGRMVGTAVAHEAGHAVPRTHAARNQDAGAVIRRNGRLGVVCDESQGQPCEVFANVFLKEMARVREDGVILAFRAGDEFLEHAIHTGHNLIVCTKGRQEGCFK